MLCGSIICKSHVISHTYTTSHDQINIPFAAAAKAEGLLTRLLHAPGLPVHDSAHSPMHCTHYTEFEYIIVFGLEAHVNLVSL